MDATPCTADIADLLGCSHQRAEAILGAVQDGPEAVRQFGRPLFLLVLFGHGTFSLRAGFLPFIFAEEPGVVQGGDSTCPSRG